MPNQHAEDEALGVRSVEPPQRYSVFTNVEKWCIVAMVSYAAWFSTLSSFIYYPAIPAISKALGVSVDKVNLTITTYMAIASVAPALVGDTADILGRRPVYILTLSGYFAANFAIALTRSYEALLGLRVLQALCISGTFSIAYGVVTDLAAPAERGSFAALVSFAITIAPSIGPILGGVLTYAAGWPWIFWFLCLASGSCLVIMTLFLPETARHVVGDGSIPPPHYLRLPIPTILCHWKETEMDSDITTRSFRAPNPFKSIAILCHKDNAVVIFACGLLYVVYTCINASLATLLVEIYHLNQWEAGLIYLPFGLGGVASAFISGRVLDRAWRNTRVKMGMGTNALISDDLDTFPVERARLCVIWVPMFLTVCSVIAFGWTLHNHLDFACNWILA
ncbi:chloramphenicol resistance protein [Penicillium waksmanii]|uniref:chloramphenicol resistance protein n=1 Tax=Penicillium waksmanii TaxID=69791 RepID=UPI00254848D7|nr:chloramphenicol resistance protein [Penicillium waksmanii]KAJ6000279.1 chloramphenicol resistance protein [Penicillium waksmanii]